MIEVISRPAGKVNWRLMLTAGAPMAAVTGVALLAAKASAPASELKLLVIGSTIFALLLLAISYRDARSMTVPDELSFALATVGFAFLMVLDYDGLRWRLAEAALVFSAAVVIVLVAQKLAGRPVIGFGDIKLLVAITIWTGSFPILTVLIVASLSGLLAAYFIFRRRKRSVRYLPFAPHIAAGAWFVWLCGPIAFD